MKQIQEGIRPRNETVMNRKQHILSLFRENRSTLVDIGVRSIGIFGSVVREQDSESSDYDILVEFEPECRTYRNFNLVCDFLDQELGENYDLVTVDGLSPYLGPKILHQP